MKLNDIPLERRRAVAHVMRQDATILEHDYAHLAGDFKPRTREAADVLIGDLRALADYLASTRAAKPKGHGGSRPGAGRPRTKRSPYRPPRAPTKEECDRFMTPAIERILVKYPSMRAPDGSLKQTEVADRLVLATVVWMADRESKQRGAR